MTEDTIEKENLIEEYNQKIYNGEVSVSDALDSLFEKGKSSRDSQQEIEPKGNIKPSADTIQKGCGKIFDFFQPRRTEVCGANNYLCPKCSKKEVEK